MPFVSLQMLPSAGPPECPSVKCSITLVSGRDRRRHLLCVDMLVAGDDAVVSTFVV